MRAPAPVLVLLAVGFALIAGCATTPKSGGAARKGGYYQDDGPGDNPPANLDQIADATPRVEPYLSGPNRPYSVFGTEYTPDLSDRPLLERGVGSWYGRKFHGQRTSSGEVYDMYAMTAAHPTLPIPSYARVTNLANGRTVIVRINDRGPFHSGRIIDLSFAAAYKLGYANQGSTLLEVERLLPRDIAAGRYAAPSPLVASATPANGAASRTLPTNPTHAPTAAGAPSAAPLPAAPPLAAPTSASLPVTTGEDLPADLVPADAPERLPLAPAPAVAADPSALFVQLGAFHARAGADDFMRHLAEELEPSLAQRLRLVAAGGIFRVQLGPYTGRGEAEEAAARLREGLGFSPVVVNPR